MLAGLGSGRLLCKARPAVRHPVAWVLARGGRRVAQVPSAGRHPARWLHAVVESELGKPLHVVSLYGYDSGQPGAPERNAELFQDVFGAMAELGTAQWVVGGDWNEEAAAIWELVAAGHRSPLLPRGAAEVPGGTCGWRTPC